MTNFDPEVYLPTREEYLQEAHLESPTPTPQELTRHLLIVRAPGTGKTNSVKSLIQHINRLNATHLILDFKAFSSFLMCSYTDISLFK